MKQFRSISTQNKEKKQFDILINQIRCYQQSEEKPKIRPQTMNLPKSNCHKLPIKFKYCLDDHWMERLYPKQQIDPKFEFVKTRERALLRSQNGGRWNSRNVGRGRAREYVDSEDDEDNERRVRFERNIRTADVMSLRKKDLDDEVDRSCGWKKKEVGQDLPSKLNKNDKNEQRKEIRNLNEEIDFIYNKNEKLESQIEKMLKKREIQLRQKQERQKEQQQKRVYYQQQSFSMVNQMRNDMKRFSNNF